MRKTIEKFKKIRSSTKRLESKKGGSELITFIVIVAVVSLLAVNTLPSMMQNVRTQGTESVKKIDSLNNIFK